MADDSVVAEAQALVMNYVADREAWERTATSRMPVHGGEMSEEEISALDDVSREYMAILGKYFDDAALREAQASWGDPPTVSLRDLQFVGARIAAKRILVDTLEPGADGQWRFRYDIRRDGNRLKFRDRSLVDSRTGRVNGVF
jgi:hypothetical protein